MGETGRNRRNRERESGERWSYSENIWEREGEEEEKEKKSTSPNIHFNRNILCPCKVDKDNYFSIRRGSFFAKG